MVLEHGCDHKTCLANGQFKVRTTFEPFGFLYVKDCNVNNQLNHRGMFLLCLIVLMWKEVWLVIVDGKRIRGMNSVAKWNQCCFWRVNQSLGGTIRNHLKEC